MMAMQGKSKLMVVMRRGSKEGAAVTGRAPQQDVETATVTTTTTVFSSVPSGWHDHGSNWYHAWFELHHVKDNPILACLAV